MDEDCCHPFPPGFLLRLQESSGLTWEDVARRLRVSTRYWRQIARHSKPFRAPLERKLPIIFRDPQNPLCCELHWRLQRLREEAAHIDRTLVERFEQDAPAAVA